MFDLGKESMMSNKADLVHKIEMLSVANKELDNKVVCDEANIAGLKYELEKVNKKLEMTNADHTAVNEIKALNKKIAEDKSVNDRRLQTEIKKVTDHFLKVIAKQDKVIATLKSKSTKVAVGANKLTCAEVKIIRAKYTTIPPSEILDKVAKDYGVSEYTIRRVIKNKTYTNCG